MAKKVKKAKKASTAKAATDPSQMHRYLELRASMCGLAPEIWREFLLEEDATFGDLHEAIQDAGPWSDYHLWEFAVQDGKWPKAIAKHPEAGDIYEGREVPVAADLKLAEFFTRKGMTCLYHYDFGDDWYVEVKLVGRQDLPEEFHRRLLDGARAWPPEDCGGVYGYTKMYCVATGKLPSYLKGKATLSDVVGEDDVAELREWLGGWMPEAFDLAEAKKRFDRPGR